MTHTEESRREAHERIMPKKKSRHLKVIALIEKWGPLASDQIHAIAGYGTVNSWRARLSELRDMGKIESVGRVKSAYSGVKITLWDLCKTSTPPPKKPTWKDRAATWKHMANHWRDQALSLQKDFQLTRLELKAAEIRVKRFLNG